MNFGFNEEQELLRNTARKFFENECPSDDGAAPDGDAGGHQRRALEEAGRAGLAGPHLSRGSTTAWGSAWWTWSCSWRRWAARWRPARTSPPCSWAGSPSSRRASDAQKKEWLPKIAAGDKRVALAWMEPSAQLGPAGVTLTAVEKGGKYTLSGTKLFVHDAHTADALVVAARTRPGAGADGVSLFLLPKGTKGLEVTLLPTMDQTRKLCEVACSDVTVGGDALLGAAGSGWAPLARVLDRATVALCAEMCGGRPEGARHDGRVRQDPPGLRPADRLLPGRQAPRGRHAGGRGEQQVHHLLRGVGARRELAGGARWR